jgi:CRP-like cAMP-binding protein
MFENFEKYITDKASITNEELLQIRSLAVEKRVCKREFVLQEGEVCRHKIFVVKGLLRTYRLADNGTEHMMRFSPENAWSIDHESYSRRQPSQYYTEAMEDSELLVWTRDSMDRLFAEIPAFRLFSEQVKETSINDSQQRILMNISYTAEEKYNAFVQSFPEVFSRVPLHMVASYLGVSRETLSRIRHAQLSRRKKHIVQ